MGRWSRLVADTFLDWLKAHNNLRWLDVGCGNGAFTAELIARCMPTAVTAIDPSDEQLAYARTRLGVSMADFRVGDAQNLPFADDSFDVATMALVISSAGSRDDGVFARVGSRRRWLAEPARRRDMGPDATVASDHGAPDRISEA
jgi:ubiquinone/menaquinone biosynthesis C-methylase UbiE